MMIPTIHANGTRAESLIEDLSKAYDSLMIAYGDMKRTAPNGRDYYTQPDGALKAATDEHMSRLRRVHDVAIEIEALIRGIESQNV